MPIVAGIRLSREEALELGSILTREGSDRPARLLLRALTSGQDFVALTTDDKEEIVAALDRRPTTLVEVRRALFDELNWQRAGSRTAASCARDRVRRVPERARARQRRLGLTPDDAP